MKKLLILFTFFLFTSIQAQVKESYWSLGFNLPAVFETMTTIGASASYRISTKVELWSEASFVLNDPYDVTGWEKTRGYRFIFQSRFYTGRKKKLFITPELRLKQVWYKTNANFINPSLPDTLRSYSHRTLQTVPGGAVLVGGYISLSKKRNFLLEVTSGFGVKQRLIKRKNIPVGYDYKPVMSKAVISLDIDKHKQVVPYFPISYRFVWRFS